MMHGQKYIKLHILLYDGYVKFLNIFLKALGTFRIHLTKC